jgi:hypothetical protein
MYRPIIRVLLLAASALGANACNNTVAAPTTPTTPTPTVTDSFAGTLNPNGGITHTFNVTGAGAVTATLKEVAPDSTLTIGLSLGTWNGVTCQIVLASDTAAQGITVTGNVSSAGTLCARIYDVGKLTDPVTYAVDVVHPG